MWLVEVSIVSLSAPTASIRESRPTALGGRRKLSAVG
jgi:hypothetical protein